MIVAVGLLVALTSLVLALKIQFARSFVLGCAVLLLLGTTLYWARDQVIEQSIRDDSTTPQNMEQRLSQSQKPKPIAVALLHDDFFAGVNFVLPARCLFILRRHSICHRTDQNTIGMSLINIPMRVPCLSSTTQSPAIEKLWIFRCFCSSHTRTNRLIECHQT